jgi:CubicO group peptidase (beta-lactamase class C family)
MTVIFFIISVLFVAREIIKYTSYFCHAIPCNMHKPLLFVLSVFASTGAAYSQPFYPNDMIPKKEILDSMVNEYLQLSGTVGMSVAIAGRETLYYSGEFGYANKEKGEKVNPFTLFRIASVSKILTGSLLAVMVDKGIIELDKPINTYLRKPIPYGDVITARMLATHTAGIRHYQDNDFRLKISTASVFHRSKVHWAFLSKTPWWRLPASYTIIQATAIPCWGLSWKRHQASLS